MVNVTDLGESLESDKKAGFKVEKEGYSCTKKSHGNLSRSEILEIVYASIKIINEQIEKSSERLKLKEDTILLGKASKLDSLGLITLLIEIEQQLHDKLNIEVSITNEEVMSNLENVNSLVNYIFLRLQRGASG